MIEKIQSLIPAAKKYSIGQLPINGTTITKRCKNFIRMGSCLQESVKVPLSNFSRTPQGDIILYRGVYGFDTSAKRATQSAAASDGWSIKNIFEFFGKKRNRTNLREMVAAASGSSSFNDAIVHTSTKQSTACKYTQGNGIIFEFHIPVDYVKKHGLLGCYRGENEINFLHSLPKKFLARVTPWHPKKNFIPEEIPLSKQKYCFLPRFEDRELSYPPDFMTRGQYPYKYF